MSRLFLAILWSHWTWNASNFQHKMKEMSQWHTVAIVWDNVQNHLPTMVYPIHPHDSPCMAKYKAPNIIKLYLNNSRVTIKSPAWPWHSDRSLSLKTSAWKGFSSLVRMESNKATHWSNRSNRYDITYDRYMIGKYHDRYINPCCGMSILWNVRKSVSLLIEKPAASKKSPQIYHMVMRLEVIIFGAKINGKSMIHVNVKEAFCPISSTGYWVFFGYM